MDDGRSEACTECRRDYTALNTFYREKVAAPCPPPPTPPLQVFGLSVPFLEGVCFDLLDTMNSTQRRWGSGYYMCGRQMAPSAPLITAVVCVLLCPAVFYMLTRYLDTLFQVHKVRHTLGNVHQVLTKY